MVNETFPVFVPHGSSYAVFRIVLEYVDGGDLLDYVMRRKGLSKSNGVNDPAFCLTACHRPDRRGRNSRDRKNGL